MKYQTLQDLREFVEQTRHLDGSRLLEVVIEFEDENVPGWVTDLTYRNAHAGPDGSDTDIIQIRAIAD